MATQHSTLQHEVKVGSTSELLVSKISPHPHPGPPHTPSLTAPTQLSRSEHFKWLRAHQPPDTLFHCEWVLAVLESPPFAWLQVDLCIFNCQFWFSPLLPYRFIGKRKRKKNYSPSQPNYFFYPSLICPCTRKSNLIRSSPTYSQPNLCPLPCHVPTLGSCLLGWFPDYRLARFPWTGPPLNIDSWLSFSMPPTSLILLFQEAHGKCLT